MSLEQLQIIEFSAPLCSACQQVYETIGKVLKDPEYTQRVAFQKVNGLQEIPLLTTFGLADGKELLPETAFPITIFMKNGEEVLRHKNEISEEQLRSLLDQHLELEDPFANIEIQGAVIIRAFYENGDQDTDFLNNKKIIKSLMGHPKLFQRIRFEWQSRHAMFTSSYKLDQHPKGAVTLVYNQQGEEAARIVGQFSESLFDNILANVFQGQKPGLIAENKPAIVEKQTNKEQPAPATATYAKAPQHKLQLIEFYQDNCASCKALEPILTDLDKRYGNFLQFHRINGDKEPETKQKWLQHAKGDMIFYPIVFLTDEKGTVLYNSDDYKYMMEHLEQKIKHFMFRLLV